MYFTSLELPASIQGKLNAQDLKWFTFAEDCEAYKAVCDLLEGEDWKTFRDAYERVLRTLTCIVDTDECTVQVVENPASYRADIQKPVKGSAWLFQVRSSLASRKQRMQRTDETTLRQLNEALARSAEDCEEQDEEDAEDETPKPSRGRLPKPKEPKKAAICGQRATNGEKCSGVVAARYTGGGLHCLCEFHHEEATRFR